MLALRGDVVRVYPLFQELRIIRSVWLGNRSYHGVYAPVLHGYGVIFPSKMCCEHAHDRGQGSMCVSLLVSVFEPLTAQPVDSRSTDGAIPAHQLRFDARLKGSQG